MGKIKKAMKRVLLILMLFSLANTIYLRYRMDSAQWAFENAGVPDDETLIAVYHGGSTWQFATYRESDNMLVIHTFSWSPLWTFFTWSPSKNVESAKAAFNYSPLALDRTLLTQYKPHHRAFLFKTLGWVYDEDLSSCLPALEEVISQGERYYSIYGAGSRGKFWIKMEIICDPPSLFAHDYVCRGFVGYEGLLTLPDYKLEAERMTWVVRRPQEGAINVTVFYPGISLSKIIEPEKNIVRAYSFTGRSIKLLQEAVPDYVERDITYIEICVEDNVNRSSISGRFILPHDRYGTFGESLEVDGK